MNPKDVLSIDEASRYLSIDKQALAALATERRIPCVQADGAWLFSKKSIDKWRSQQSRRA